MTIDDICHALNAGRIGMIPHDTVPGIIGPMSVETAKKIQSLKNRSTTKGFIVLIPNTDWLSSLVTHITPPAQQLIHAFWPGPLTLIFHKHSTIPDPITGYQPTIAIRQPTHPFLSAVLAQWNAPLLSTSANQSNTHDLPHTLLNQLDFMVPCSHNNNPLASTIIDTTSYPLSVIRMGTISTESIMTRLNNPNT